MVTFYDFINDKIGMTNGPICISTPTHTPSPTSTGSPYPTHTPTFTITPTPTASPGPWPTPTMSPYLYLNGTGPPDWSYTFYGSTDGFWLKCTCCTGGSTPSSDWIWTFHPRGGLMCFNIISPDPAYRTYRSFTVNEDGPFGTADNAAISNEVLGPSHWSHGIDGPWCAVSPTPTPTLTPVITFPHTLTPTWTPVISTTPTPTETLTGVITVTPTPTPTGVEVPVSSDFSQYILFLFFCAGAICIGLGITSHKLVVK